MRWFLFALAVLAAMFGVLWLFPRPIEWTEAMVTTIVGCFAWFISLAIVNDLLIKKKHAGLTRACMGIHGVAGITVCVSAILGGFGWSGWGVPAGIIVLLVYAVTGILGLYDFLRGPSRTCPTTGQ